MKPPFGGTSGNLNADKRYNLALHLLQGGDNSAASELLEDTISLTPAWPPLHFYLGESLRLLGQYDDAELAFQTYILHDKEDSMGAGIKLALMGRAGMENAMSEAYVRALFDQYAPQFEDSLIKKLHYEIPTIIAGILPSSKYRNVLDLGCGTGLVGMAMSGRCEELLGVDVASSMIEQAKLKNIYTALYVTSLEAYLLSCKKLFDLIVAADVFIYAGALENIFKNICDRLCENGTFIFSVQNCSENWQLGEDHRYAHSQEYIEACIRLAGLSLLSTHKVTIRLDSNLPVLGKIVMCKKT